MERNLNEIFAKYFKPVNYEILKYNPELCRGCGGLCCKTMGCHISPEDLKDEITVESIIRLIDETGCISIDWWEGDPSENNAVSRGLFLRIKNVNAKIIDPSYGDECSILTDKGCPLIYSYRPKGARELIPAETECLVGYSKQQCAIDWLPYRDILEEVYEYYENKGEVTPRFDPLGLMESWWGNE